VWPRLVLADASLAEPSARIGAVELLSQLPLGPAQRVAPRGAWPDNRSGAASPVRSPRWNSHSRGAARGAGPAHTATTTLVDLTGCFVFVLVARLAGNGGVGGVGGRSRLSDDQVAGVPGVGVWVDEGARGPTRLGMVAPVGDQTGDQGGLSGPSHHAQHRAER
jgi:hypothetical protein